MASKYPVIIERLQPSHLPQISGLMNMHLGSLVPGWSLPVEYIASNLERCPGQYVIDPWVQERMTLCALQRQRIVAAAHLLRYGSGVEVMPDYKGSGDLAWFLAWPDAHEAAVELLSVVHSQFVAWGVTHEWAWDSCLPVGPFVGVPDVWPHIAKALEAGGYHCPEQGRIELIYGGSIAQVPVPTTPPVPGLQIRREMGTITGARFVALLNDQKIGQCEIGTDMTDGGAVPALRGWGEISELYVEEPWRKRGIGSWLVQHVVVWHRLGGGERMIFSVTAEDEAAGADRFYGRLGWHRLLHQRNGWSYGTATKSKTCE